MSPLLRAVTCVLLVLLTACAGAQPRQGSSDADTLALVARLPQQNAGFLLESSTPPSGAFSLWAADYRHAESGTTARVIISVPPGEPTPAGPDSPLVRAATNAQALAIQAEVGGGGLTRRPDFGAGLRDQPAEIRCADLQLKLDTGTALTRMLSCNTGINGRLITIALIARHQPEVADKARLFMVHFAMLMTQALRGAPLPAVPEDPPPDAPVYRL